MKNIFYTFVIILLFPFSTSAQTPFESTAKQAIVIDATTGQILYEKNADEHMPTSSMSKVMTIYMVFEALKEGRLSLDDTMQVSEKAWKKGGSKMFVKVKDDVRVEDLIRGVIVQSGNDATIVLAEGLAGSEDVFARMATTKARELGMMNSNFVNASGWPDENHYSTARDLALLAIAMIRDFPEYYRYYKEEEFTYAGIKQGNRNPLLYKDLGADGLKTGHTEDAGYGLMASAVKDGRRVVAVLNGMESMQDRADESARVVGWALNNFVAKKILADGQIIDQLPVVLGMKNAVPVAVKGGVDATIPRGSEANLVINLEYKSPLKAPIKEGDVVGTLKLSIPEQPTVERPLVAARGVEKSTGLKAFIQKSKMLFSGSGDDEKPAAEVTEPQDAPSESPETHGGE